MKTSDKNLSNQKMKKQDSKTKGMLELLLVIGIILIIPLFFTIKSLAGSQAADATATAMVEWATGTPAGTTGNGVVPSPTVMPPTEAPLTATGKQPPACTFPLAQTTTAESTLENYTFSAPETVYSPASTDSSVEIVEWLPDNQQVLVVQNIQDSNQQTIELFNSETGERQVYAKREWTEQPPFWNQESKAVIYPVGHVLKMVNNIPEYSRQVWVSYGDLQSAKMIADNLLQFYVAVKPDDGQIAYLLDKQISKQNGLLQGTTPVSFDLNQWNYRKLKSGVFPLMYEMTWRPGTSQIFLYSLADGKPGYTFLLDVDTGQICELNLGGWAFVARWSPDGRYLAIDRAQEPTLPVSSTDLAILDTATGNLYTIEVVPQELAGRHYVRDIAWAPDNRHFLVLGSALSSPQCAPNCYEDTKLYLVDFVSGQVDSILTEHQFTANNPGTNLAWSPDGSKVITLCPALCGISVKRSGQ